MPPPRPSPRRLRGLPSLALLLLLAALTLAACGSGPDSVPLATGATEAPDIVPSEPADDAPNPTTELPSAQAAEPDPGTTVETPADPGPTRAEQRAIEVAAILAQAGIGQAEPGQLTIVLDPGHGGPDEGGALNGVAEISSNLDFALRVEQILVANGFHVVLTRRDTGPSILTPTSNNAGGQPGSPTDPANDPNEPIIFRSTRPDRAARVELAEFIDADLFVSLHSNGHPDFSVNGVEAWYHPTVLLEEANQQLGSLILGRVMAELFAYGYEAAYLGIKDDTCWRQFGNVCRSLYVLSPPLVLQRDDLEARGIDPAEAGFSPTQNVLYARGTKMPAVLIELLFVSNEQDAAVLRDFQGRQAIARGVAQGIIEFFATRDSFSSQDGLATQDAG